MQKACHNCWFENNPTNEEGDLTEPCSVCNIDERSEFVPREKFYELYKKGLIIADSIDDFIDCWHDNEYLGDITIYEFLGISQQQYRVWVNKGIIK